MQFGMNFPGLFLRVERLLWDAEQSEHLPLQVGELYVEHLDDVAVTGQLVSLSKAEETQNLFGSGVCAETLLRVQGQAGDFLALHGGPQFTLDESLNEEREKIQGE